MNYHRVPDCCLVTHPDGHFPICR